ncbi:hypothetical protein [Alkalisalibacterium limincola]|uniref:Secreted protein n=1 Tax=Alkalisalibacterium limincola TaxID=2699169 RepID=A0A5C8KQD4_9GAMM|nr:hypothetical protein [Alkalisalibacterium limincola]TXK62633.1 hypothetical protein FU658_07790 [Alkalisalibacterium limincola]
MRSIPRALLAFFFLLLPLGLAHAQEFSSLEERMSGSEFRAAGLEKLSAEELEALNRWLRTQMGAHGAAGVAAAAPVEPVDTRGLRQGTGFDEDIITSIPGNFRGWSGRGQRIRFANGQVWETVDSTSRLTINVEDPAVRIHSGMLGAWYLSVDGYNTRVRVRRIQ